MGTYHHTDTLGRALESVKLATKHAAEQLADADRELAAERESHRAETLQLVERAEAAERRATVLEGYASVSAARRLEDEVQRLTADRARHIAQLEKLEKALATERGHLATLRAGLAEQAERDADRLQVQLDQVLSARDRFREAVRRSG